MNLKIKKKVYTPPQMEVVRMKSCFNLLQGSNTEEDDDVDYGFNLDGLKNDKA